MTRRLKRESQLLCGEGKFIYADRAAAEQARDEKGRADFRVEKCGDSGHWHVRGREKP